MGQSRQIVVLPSFTLYYPVVQLGLFEATSIAFINRQALPSGQSMHLVYPAKEYFPLGHKAGSLLASAQKYPAGHVVQVEAEPKLNFPESHGIGD